MAKRRKSTDITPQAVAGYDSLLTGISDLLDEARRTSARTINSILTATYWEIGRRIVEFEQGGKARAEYGARLWKQLAADLTAKHGRGFSKSNLALMRAFYLGWDIFQTPSGKLDAKVKASPEAGGGGGVLPKPADDSPGEMIEQTVSAELPLASSPIASPVLGVVFPLSWSHHVRLMSVEKPHARAFYEAEAIRGGWSVRQLDRQISTQFFERTSQSKRREATLARGQKAKREDAVSVQDAIRDPYLLEFLDLKEWHEVVKLRDDLSSGDLPLHLFSADLRRCRRVLRADGSLAVERG